MEIDLSDDWRDAIDDHYDLIVRIADVDAAIKGAELMFRTSGVICAGASLRRRFSTPEDLTDLCWNKTPTMGQDLSLTSIGTVEIVTLTPGDYMVVNSGQLVRELVDESVGFAVFPDFAISSALRNQKVSNVLPRWQAGERGFFAIHSARNAKLSIARSFVDGWKDYMKRTCG